MTSQPKVRIVGNIAGRALMGFGIMLLGAEFVRSLERGMHTRFALGEFWYLADASSLNGLQAGVQRYLVPEIWDKLFAPLLFAPAWSVFLVLGLTLSFLTRSKQPSSLWF